MSGPLLVDTAAMGPTVQPASERLVTRAYVAATSMIGWKPRGSRSVCLISRQRVHQPTQWPVRTIRHRIRLPQAASVAIRQRIKTNEIG